MVASLLGEQGCSKILNGNKDTGGLERSSLERKRRQGVQLVPLRHATMLTKLHTNFIIVCTASVSLITSLASLM